MNEITLKFDADVAQMTPGELAEQLVLVDEFLRVEAANYRDFKDVVDDLQSDYDTAKKQFDELHKDLISGLETTSRNLELSKRMLQDAAVLRFQLTGEKTYLAFQVAETTTFKYDAKQFFTWVVTQAPTKLKEWLLKLDDKQTKAFLDEQYQDGEFLQIDNCSPYQAIATTTYVGKVLSAKLDDVPPPKSVLLTPDEMAEREPNVPTMVDANPSAWVLYNPDDETAKDQ